MGLFKTIVCRKCGREHSALRSSCPKCGARKQTLSNRTAASSDSVRNGTQSSRRAQQNTRYQLISGLLLVAAIIISVIVLIVTMVNGNYESYPTPTPSAELTPPPTLEPTPTPTPTPIVETVTITFLGEDKDEFSMRTGNTIKLDATIYPIEIEGPIEWTSTDEAVVIISEDGLVTATGTGSARIICRCYGAASECKVLVW